MCLARICAALVVAGLSVAGTIGTAVGDVDFTPQTCVRAPHDRLCPHFPDDQTDFSAVFEYLFINTAAQDPFDHHAWQAFVALNWPLADDDAPVAALASAPDAPHTRRVWSRFASRDDVFRPDRAAACPDSADVIVRTSDLVQADGTVLIDQSGNFVVYETRLNPVAEAYIRDNALDTRAGQAAFDPQPVEFPQGRLGAQATPASVLLKTSWRVMQSGETGYLTASGLIYVPDHRSASGVSLCLPVTLGMVGMHIVTRVASGNGGEWLWSTFEHRDNVPVAGSARQVNSLLALELFPEGCTHPTDTGSPQLVVLQPRAGEPADQHAQRRRLELDRPGPLCPDPRQARHTTANRSLLGSSGRHPGGERDLASPAGRFRATKLHADFLAMARRRQQPALPPWRTASIPHQHDGGDLRPDRPERNLPWLPHRRPHRHRGGRQLHLLARQCRVNRSSQHRPSWPARPASVRGSASAGSRARL